MDKEQKAPISKKTNDDEFEEVFHGKSFSEIAMPYLQKLWLVRRKLIYINGAVLLIAVAYQFFFVKPYFDSTITILPDYGGKSVSGGIGGLATLAGISLPDGNNPVEIYQNLLTSETVITPVVYARYQTKKFRDSVNLIQYFEIKEDDSIEPRLRQRKMFLEIYQMLTKSAINTTIEPVIKILLLRLRMPEAELSSVVANNLVGSLDNYVRTKRKTNATEQRLYIEKRISEVLDSLTIAENNLMIFQLNNRVMTQSPNLLLTRNRLDRQVQILQGVYAELIRQLELVKINEIKDASIVNIREPAGEPMQKSGPSRMITIILLAFSSFIISILYYLFLDIKKIKNFFNKVIE